MCTTVPSHLCHWGIWMFKQLYIMMLVACTCSEEARMCFVENIPLKPAFSIANNLCLYNKNCVARFDSENINTYCLSFKNDPNNKRVHSFYVFMYLWIYGLVFCLKPLMCLCGIEGLARYFANRFFRNDQYSQIWSHRIIIKTQRITHIFEVNTYSSMP